MNDSLISSSIRRGRMRSRLSGAVIGRSRAGSWWGWEQSALRGNRKPCELVWTNESLGQQKGGPLDPLQNTRSNSTRQRGYRHLNGYFTTTYSSRHTERNRYGSPARGALSEGLESDLCRGMSETATSTSAGSSQIGSASAAAPPSPARGSPPPPPGPPLPPPRATAPNRVGEGVRETPGGNPHLLQPNNPEQQYAAPRPAARRGPPAVPRPRRRRDEPLDESTEDDTDEDDHQRGNHARDIADERPHDVGQRVEAEGVRREQNHGEHHEPEHQVGENARRIQMRARPLDGLRHAAALEHPVQSDLAERAFCPPLQHLP